MFTVLAVPATGIAVARILPDTPLALTEKVLAVRGL
jgi:hypothetical protein